MFISFETETYILSNMVSLFIFFLLVEIAITILSRWSNFDEIEKKN